MVNIEILTSPAGCSKCKHAMDIIHDVLSKYTDNVKIAEIDIIQKPEKLIEFNVMATPAVIINGKLAFEGSMNKEDLHKKIKEALR